MAHGNYGGGGSGGRLALFLTSALRLGSSFTALGGDGYRKGGPGTVYIHVAIANKTSERLIIDNMNRDESYYVTIKVPKSKIDVLELYRRAVITLPQVLFLFFMKRENFFLQLSIYSFSL